MSSKATTWKVVVDPDGRTRQVPCGTADSEGSGPALGVRHRAGTFVSPPEAETPQAAPFERLTASKREHQHPSHQPSTINYQLTTGFRLALIAANQRARAARKEVEFLREQVGFLNGQMDASRQAERELRMLFATTARPALEAAMARAPEAKGTQTWGWAAWIAVLTPTLASAAVLTWFALNNWQW